MKFPFFGNTCLEIGNEISLIRLREYNIVKGVLRTHTLYFQM
jgi:hypothetical protein